MMFRNLSLWRFPPGTIADTATLTAALDSRPLREIGPMELACSGFAPPTDEPDSPTTLSVGTRDLFALRVTEKILPPAVIREELQRRVVEIMEREGRRVRSRERSRLRDQVIAEFLPRAFTRPRRTFAYVDHATGWLVIDTASRRVAEFVISQLREALGSFPCTPCTPEESPRALMTQWLVRGTCAPLFTLGTDCDLRDPADSVAARWTGRAIDLESDDVKAHLYAGMQVVRLGLEFDQRLGLQLDDDLTIRRLHLHDIVLDQINDEDFETRTAEIAAQFALVSGEVDRLLAVLSEIFGIPREARLHLDGGDAPETTKPADPQAERAARRAAKRDEAIAESMRDPKNIAAMNKAVADASRDPGILDALSRLAPKPGSGIDSVTISSPGGQSVTLTQADRARFKSAAQAARGAGK